MKINIQKCVGNAFILMGVSLIILFFLPYLLAFLPKKIPPVAVTSDFSITIPKISAHSLIIPNIDPWDSKTYQKALRLGVAQAKGTAFPDEKGTMYVFAHSSAPPWDILWHNPDFLRLNELKNRDKIIITYKKKTYMYEVINTKVVWPTDTKYLTKNGDSDLILQTCTPIPTAYQRLLVFARKVI